MKAGRALNDSEKLTLKKARQLLTDHFYNSFSLGDMVYGKFPGTMLDSRTVPPVVHDVRTPNHLLRIARKAVSQTNTERVTAEDRAEIKRLAKQYEKFELNFTVGRFKGDYPNGHERRPFGFNRKVSPTRPDEYKSFKRISDLRVYLQKHFVEIEPDIERLRKLKMFAKLHFNNDVKLWGDHNRKPAIYTIHDNRKNVGCTKTRHYYDIDSFERAVTKLCRALHTARDEVIYREEKDVLHALEHEFDGQFKVTNSYKGVTASGTVRKPFVVVYLNQAGKRCTRSFAEAEELKEYVEKNLPKRVAEAA